MTKTVIDIPDSALYSTLQLAAKYRDKPFPIPETAIADDLRSALAVDVAQAVSEYLAIGSPIGRQLVVIANKHIDDAAAAYDAPEEIAIGNSTTALAPDGTLVIGEGNPASDLVAVDNGKLQTILGCRRYRDLDTPAVVDGKYDIAIEDGDDWNIVYGVQLLEGTTSNICELYDITFAVYGDVTAKKEGGVSWKLDRDGGQYVWRSLVSGVGDITDSAVAANGTIIQNITRLSFYGDKVLPPTTGTPLGKFVVELVAKYRATGVEMTNSVIADVHEPVVVPPVEPPATEEPKEEPAPVEPPATEEPAA